MGKEVFSLENNYFCHSTWGDQPIYDAFKEISQVSKVPVSLKEFIGVGSNLMVEIIVLTMEVIMVEFSVRCMKLPLSIRLTYQGMG